MTQEEGKGLWNPFSECYFSLGEYYYIFSDYLERSKCQANRVFDESIPSVGVSPISWKFLAPYLFEQE